MINNKTIHRCLFCGKELGGFVFEHNCPNKASRGIWDTKRIMARKRKDKIEKMITA